MSWWMVIMIIMTIIITIWWNDLVNKYIIGIHVIHSEFIHSVIFNFNYQNQGLQFSFNSTPQHHHHHHNHHVTAFIQLSFSSLWAWLVPSLFRSDFSPFANAFSHCFVTRWYISAEKLLVVPWFQVIHCFYLN